MGTATLKRARMEFASNSSIELNPEGQRRFAALMACPPRPTEAMKALGKMLDFEESGKDSARIELVKV
jgi:hypothetical protein